MKDLIEKLKQKILCSIAKFGGKLMFAALKLHGSTNEMLVVSNPYSATHPLDLSNVELLMEFPRQAWF